MAKVADKQQQPNVGTKFYDIITGKFIEQVQDGKTQIISINPVQYSLYSMQYEVYLFKNTISFTDFIIKKSQNDADFHILPGLTTEELNVRAFLTVIRQAERGPSTLTPLPYNAHNGTSKGKLNLFTENKFEDAPKDYAKHPGKLNGRSAAGAYQFMASVWIRYVKKYAGLDDFSPQNQDKAAVCMLYDSKVLKYVEIGEIIKAKQILSDKDQWVSFAFFTDNKILELFNMNIISELSYNSVIYTPFGFGLLDIQLI